MIQRRNQRLRTCTLKATQSGAEPSLRPRPLTSGATPPPSERPHLRCEFLTGHLGCLRWNLPETGTETGFERLVYMRGEPQSHQQGDGEMKQGKGRKPLQGGLVSKLHCGQLGLNLDLGRGDWGFHPPTPSLSW